MKRFGIRLPVSGTAHVERVKGLLVNETIYRFVAEDGGEFYGSAPSLAVAHVSGFAPVVKLWLRAPDRQG